MEEEKKKEKGTCEDALHLCIYFMWSKLSHSLDFGAHMHASYCLRPFFLFFYFSFLLMLSSKSYFPVTFFYEYVYRKKKKCFFWGQNMLYKVRIIRNIFVKCKLRKRKKELSIFFNWNITFEKRD